MSPHKKIDQLAQQANSSTNNQQTVSFDSSFFFG
jgi:hypothetical protein